MGIMICQAQCYSGRLNEREDSYEGSGGVVA
jgi:hypothetical protein